MTFYFEDKIRLLKNTKKSYVSFAAYVIVRPSLEYTDGMKSECISMEPSGQSAKCFAQC